MGFQITYKVGFGYLRTLCSPRGGVGVSLRYVSVAAFSDDMGVSIARLLFECEMWGSYCQVTLLVCWVPKRRTGL